MHLSEMLSKNDVKRFSSFIKLLFHSMKKTTSKRSTKPIACPGFVIVTKPVLTMSSMGEPWNFRKNSCIVCGGKTKLSDINIDNTFSFHKRCKDKVCCDICQRKIGKRFVIENGHILHQKCHSQIFSSRCFICGCSMEGANIYEWNGFVFHEDCFSCSFCHHKINSKESVHDINGLPVCNTCYANKEKKCLRCNESIEKSQMKKFLFNGKAFYMHDFCSVCYECSQELSRNNFVYEQNKAICRQCWVRGLSHECQECHEPVLSNNIMDYHGCWHNECIKCIKCHQSMKFTGIKIEKDQMFCDECIEGMKKHCGACGQVVDKEPIIRHQRMFHHRCFKCNVCHIQIGQNNSAYLYGKLYCSSCIPNNNH
ncbi:hypothetical protein TRFO_03306 [Tritrichomonas foetus]|uniref:LIM zinc-binding domain-containing protein n=1 Tax=Tritrichomonas foetus TaxID=1144522 RepID=A0A1J4KV30_9EUKA|nr:hypothetical protein TRFO_03306 [Tritrichomonas foetus]|eukprot:OHT13558.1 hypothetical protein TRFO_03306 [Tritrichomonas foetus]